MRALRCQIANNPSRISVSRYSTGVSQASRQDAGGHHRGVGGVQRGADLGGHGVQGGGGAEHHAAAQAIHGVGAQQPPGGGLQLHLGQTGGVLDQRFQRKLGSGQDHPAHQAALGVHGQQGHGGVQVHHQQGRGVQPQRPHRRAEQLGAQLGRVIHPDAHPALEPGAHLHDGSLGHLLQGFPQPAGEHRHHAGQDHRLDVQRGNPVQFQHVDDLVAEFVRAQRTVGVQPGGEGQPPVPGIAAEGDVGVADVECQQHVGAPFYRIRCGGMRGPFAVSLH